MARAHRSASGRRQAPPLRSITRFLLAAAVAFLLTAAAVSLYTPLLHRALGDTTVLWGSDGTDPVRPAAAKVRSDLLAGLANALWIRQPPAVSALPTYDLFLTEEAAHDLNRSILRYGLGDLGAAKPRVRALASENGGALVGIDAGYRGTNSWHHQGWKASWRLRFPKGAMPEGIRDHVLVAPEDPSGMRGWLLAALAADQGLVTPQETHVRLFLNGRFEGVYTRACRLDGNLLARLGRNQGPFFRLEANTGPVFARRPGAFGDPLTWEIANGSEPEARGALAGMVRAAAQATGPVPADLDPWFDREAFATWMALLIHSAERSVGNHNIAFYLDPGSGRMHPVPLDIVGYAEIQPGQARQSLLRFRAPFTHAWLSDPDHLRLTVDHLWALLQGDGSADAAAARVRTEWARVRPDMLADLNASDMGNRQGVYARTLVPVTALDGDVEDLIAFAAARAAFLRSELEQVRIVAEETRGTTWVRVEGAAGCTVERRDGAPVEAHAPGIAIVHAGDVLELAPSLSPVLLRINAFDGASPAFGLYALNGLASDFRFRHRLTGADLAPEAGAARMLEAEPGIHPWARVDGGALPEVVLGPGIVRLDAHMSWEPGRRVRVLPGTEIRVPPGGSVLVRGPLAMEGTEQAPIRVHGEGGGPWGTFAVVGEGARGCRIRHAVFEGGTSDRYHNLALDGMLVIADTSDAEVSNVVLLPATGGPAALSLRNARIRLSAVSCAGGGRAGVQVLGGEVDARELTVRRSPVGWRQQGGTASVSGIRVDGASGAALLLEQNARGHFTQVGLSGGGTGLQASDGARLECEGGTVQGFEHGAQALHPDWRYPVGGRVRLRGVLFRDNRRDTHHDHGSSIVAEDGTQGGGHG